ncbi:class I adenylate-forming enzyme family protein [Mycolicibacter algericus]|uniref:Cyclohexanecarboxylate-CoA ligase n=2 Tax=Mycolicibacter algericus TaxID=1288388 RepID=A0A7I9Y5J3_MYCAL|nr:class I adenylate-forming enzyme family protein [Mycolicibacter algericus]OQZ93244.1 cyclohex-1-ene-1-carboxylate:CoA ligase [Mycolicibacter algericus DSM 45454]GFG83945.1 cyclohexanecarboxylate-CoA ligase [Mycolicibacter algericus]
MTVGTIAGLLDEFASARPGRPLLRDIAGQTLTVAEVAALTTAGTHWLWEAGVRPGMTVAWQFPSNVSAALVMLSLARMDVIQAPVLHLYREREVAAAYHVAGADMLLVDESTAANAPNEARVMVLPTDFIELLRATPRWRPPELDYIRSPTDARWLYFTSGTTGRPKAVRHSDATLLAAARGYAQHLGMGDYPDEVGTVAFPIAHIGGVVYLGAALLTDVPLLMLPKVTADDLPGLLASHRVTVTGGSTVFYQMLLSAQLATGSRRPLIPSLRMLIGGGAPCPPELHKQVRKEMGIPIVHAYGMTEAAMVCVSQAADTDEQQSNSSGLPIPGAAVRISSADEIELRGDNLTPGYVDPEEWSRATTPDGWFRTGDRGYLRSDGRLVITGRSKDLIIRKGENIAPEEIENELLAHPLVDEVAVLGQPDVLRGEMVCAVVRRSARHRDVTLDELCAFLDKRGLMKQKWPERLVIVDEFPLTGLGKVAKTELAQRIAGGSR